MSLACGFDLLHDHFNLDNLPKQLFGYHNIPDLHGFCIKTTSALLTLMLWVFEDNITLSRAIFYYCL